MSDLNERVGTNRYGEYYWCIKTDLLLENGNAFTLQVASMVRRLPLNSGKAKWSGEAK